ncbi:hypothetical protein HID58_001918 [Brassica napus]|uniref:BnaA01g17640D protein n=3 Tax=Brassica TaxID=3705 RepID=A0A078H0K0_BRANA|nr:hypothetical protein HID58_001918 [Brassica napus]CDY32220.1 BnaA01g17640D [Brassica napus]
MDVTWDNINFRLSYSPLSRRFNDSTPFTELTETVNPMAGYFSTPYLELISTLAKATVAGKLYYEKALSFSVQQDQTDEAVSHQTDEAVFVTFDTEILNRQTFELLKLHILWSAH